jgi:hypothetical protein
MYKEKYIKYKTKYIALLNYLGGNSNIIQDGGSTLEEDTSFALRDGNTKLIFESLYEDAFYDYNKRPSEIILNTIIEYLYELYIIKLVNENPEKVPNKTPEEKKRIQNIIKPIVQAHIFDKNDEELRKFILSTTY